MLLSSVSCFSQSLRSSPSTRSVCLSDALSMLRHSGCLLGKFSALLTSHTAEPVVSASATMLLKPFSRRPAYSASSIGCSALSNLSDRRWLAGRLGVAVRDLHRDFFVVAEHHRRLVIAV